MSRVICLDYETFYSKEYSVVDLGYYKYCRDPRFDPYMISVCDGAETWAGHPREFNFDALKGATLLSHNAHFDTEVSLAAEEQGKFALPGEFYNLPPGGAPGERTSRNWYCTANMSSYLWNVRSLAEACKIGLGVGVDKGVRDKAKGKTWDDMVREGWSQDMLKYAAADASLCWQLYNKHGSKWPLFERRLSELTIDQGRYGIQIDVAALDQGIALMQRVIFTAEQNLPWTQRGRKPASPLGIAEECRMVGIPTPPVKTYEPEAAAEWEELYAPKHKFVLALKNLRKAKKTLATLETIRLRIREDGTVSFSLKYCGAHSRRWAGDSGWNLQNQNKEPIYVDAEMSFLLDKKILKEKNDLFDDEQKKLFKANKPSMPAFGELGGVTFLNMRGLIMARPGKKLCPVDLAQIEPRVLNYLAGNHELLALVRQGMAIYEAHARASMGWTEGDLKTLNKMLYALAKARVLGLGYGCGWEKFIILAAMYGIDITEKDEEFALRASIDGKIYDRTKVQVSLTKHKWVYRFAPEGAKLECDEHREPLADEETQRVIFVEATRRNGEKYLKPLTVYGMQSRTTVDEFRASNPKIVEMWGNMETVLRNSVGEDLVINLPNGDALIYRNVRVDTREKTDPDTGEKYSKTVYTAEIGGKRYILYGGLIVENIIQCVSRHVFAERMLALVDAGYRVLFSVHDEAVPEVSPDTDPREIERIMSVTPDWLEGCPLGAEAKLSDRYLK